MESLNEIHGPLGNLNRTYPAPYPRRATPTGMYFNVGSHLTSLPKSVDLRKSARVSIYNQGTTSSCAGNAICSAYSMLHVLRRGVPINLSRLFVYYNARKVNGRQFIDGGCHLADAIASLRKEGCCLESLWPFDPTKVTTPPNEMCYVEALKHCVEQQNSELNPNNLLNEIKQCLANNLPVIIGVLVYTSFESENVAKTGNIPLPNIKTESLKGGHALAVVGYDDDRRVVCVQNSWGNNWADQGFGYIPYDFISNTQLTFDCHAITDIEIDRTIPTPVVPIPPIPQPIQPPIQPPWVQPPIPQPPWVQPVQPVHPPWFTPPNPWVYPPWFFPPNPNPIRPRPRPRPRNRQGNQNKFKANQYN